MTEVKRLKDEAFGIVPILQKDGDARFLLLQHNAGHWGFPKGHAELSESALEAARREFIEETGIPDLQILEDASFSEKYTFMQRGHRINKTVIYFIAFVQSETVEFQAEEIQAYTWATYEEAIAKLSFETARQVLTSVREYLTNHSG